MTSKARTFVVLGIVAGLAACGGNPFSGNDDSPPTGSGGTSEGHAGAPDSSQAGDGNGAANTGGTSSPGIGGKSSTAGTSTTAGTATSEGGTGPGSEGGAPSGLGGGDDGAAGEDEGPTEPVFTVSKLLDDMEDGNPTLLESNGDWFVFKDATGGTITPGTGQLFTMGTLAPPRGQSTKSVAVTVSGFTGWGAAFGFDFSYVTGVRQATDLKEALAVRFWAKANKATTVRLQMPNVDTDPLGGKCSGTGTNACNSHFSKTFSVGTDWKQVAILFADLAQDPSGRQVPSFDKQHVYSTFFVIGPNQSVTIWVDDIELVH